jgi:hypothetical protein
MVVNRLLETLINSHIAPKASRLDCQKKNFSNANTFFLDNSDRGFYCEKNNVSQIYTYIPKIQKKVKKTLLSSMLNPPQ